MSHCRTSLWLGVLATYVAAVAPLSAQPLQFGLPLVGDVPLNDNRNGFLGLPSSDEDGQILVSRRQYLLSWSAERKVPRWVAWQLNKRLLGEVNRTNVFRLDRDLEEYLLEQGLSNVRPDDYRGSCLDRGHQVASGDRTANLDDNQSTFFMSNIMPQSAFLNRRTWVSLERFLRHLVLEQGKEVFVYTGSMFGGSGRIGPDSDIHVAKRNFKIAVIKPAVRREVSLSEMRLLVVDFPNTTSKGTDPVRDHEQACYDSEHTVRLGESNRVPYWRPNVSTLEKVSEQSGLDLKFLRRIPVLTEKELDELIGALSSFAEPFPSLPQIIHNTAQTIAP